jgi:DNA-binding MarR family transcriptional regulator
MKNIPKGGFLIGIIQRVSGRIFNKKLKKYEIDLNSAQGRILFVLWQHKNGENGMSFNELAQKVSMGKSTLSSVLGGLENAGHLYREPVKGNRKKTQVKLTKKNKILQNKYQQVSDEMNDLFYRGFKNSEITEFEDYLTRLVENLTEYEKVGMRSKEPE